MGINGAQRIRIPFQTLAASSVIAFVHTACGEKSPPPPKPESPSPVRDDMAIVSGS